MADLGLVPMQFAPQAWRHLVEILAERPGDAMAAACAEMIRFRLTEIERAFESKDGRLEYNVTVTLKAA